MNLTKYQIYQILRNFNIKTYSEPNHNGWVKIRCPSLGHNDKNPSAGVNINNSVVKCFSCNFSSNLIKVVQDRLNLSYSDTIKHIKKMISLEVIDTKPLPPVRSRKEDKIKFPESCIKLNTDKYLYTIMRGFTKEFCNKYNIKHCFNTLYLNYMIVPVIDKNKGIECFEARKLMEYEYLKRFFTTNRSFDSKIEEYEYLKNVFKKVNIGTDENYSDVYKYLSKPKTLYPKNSRINETLFDIDNLDRNIPLYICEGIGSIPKIKSVYKNCTCTFGSNVSKYQLNYLMEFKEIVIIPDNDDAGLRMVENIYKKLSNNNSIYVLRTKYEDTDNEFIDSISNYKIKKANEFILKRNIF